MLFSYFLGGMKWDICLAFKIGFGSLWSSEARGVIWPICEAIELSYSIGLDFSPENLSSLAKDFSDICPASATAFDGVVLALDGWVMQTRAPHNTEVDNIMSYRNRKGVFGVVILAGCDARTKFHMWNNKNTGSTNDCTAWDNSSLKKKIDHGALPQRYYFIGDEAFVLGNQFLIPWGGQGIGVAKDSYNYHLSVRRQVIERAFGILVKRWGVFARALVVSHSRWFLVSSVCAKLHNICIDKNVPFVQRFTLDSHADDNDELLDNILHDGDIGPIGARGSNRGVKRQAITQALVDLGVQRPGFAMINSRAN